jgi:hypothetical protein
MVATLLPIAFLAANSATSRMVRSLFDDTFSGVHQLGWFDWAILIPYFAILAVLSVYGVHRYEIIRTYFKHRKKATGEPPMRFAQLPPVTIQLPIFNERYVIERLIDEVTRIEYPRELLQIQVLDDSTDDTAPFAAALVERYCALGFPIEYQTATIAQASKPAPCRQGCRPLLVNSSPFSMPISFHRRISSRAPSSISPTPPSASCRPAGAI